jgi:hypothetical protein
MSANLTLNAKNHARQALLETDVSNKLDLIAKAIEALAGAVEDIENTVDKIDRAPRAPTAEVVERGRPTVRQLPRMSGWTDPSPRSSRVPIVGGRIERKTAPIRGRDQADGRRQ